MVYLEDRSILFKTEVVNPKQTPRISNTVENNSKWNHISLTENNIKLFFFSFRLNVFLSFVRLFFLLFTLFSFKDIDKQANRTDKGSNCKFCSVHVVCEILFSVIHS